MSKLKQHKQTYNQFPPDITWHPAGNPAGDSETSSMQIAHSAVQYVGVESMLHMTCVGSTKHNVSGYLEKAKGLGLRNILALRGDLPNIDEEWQYDPEKFNYGTDLVRHIRQTTGDYFTICVAGYQCFILYSLYGNAILHASLYHFNVKLSTN